MPMAVSVNLLEGMAIIVARHFNHHPLVIVPQSYILSINEDATLQRISIDPVRSLDCIVRMNFLYYCSVLFLFANYADALRCRSGNQPSDDQVHKVMQKCRKKHSGNDGKSGKDYTMSNENQSSDDNSESVSSIDDDLFFRDNNKASRNNNSRSGTSYGQSSYDSYGNNRQNDRRRLDSSGNRPSYSNPTNYSSMNDRGNGMSRDNERWSNRHGMPSQNREGNNDDRRNRSECASQCFFDELNVVDHRGFPERGSVVQMMTRGVQDPNVRDFIEESISECFHYLDADSNNREKCAFSHHLMSCFTDKGKERCDDWYEK